VPVSTVRDGNDEAERRAIAVILTARDISDGDITVDDGGACASVTSSRVPDVR
jgi:hypothetical protein